ncbi:hypothetical protein HYH03_008267 [Edaphochlamys debaryana]|uniref:DNA repair metallo-beta-lactamase domain-containing protein n=1 Tax=Edaphochlamys debaryana TaxID=47281 RepID=A0A836BZJ5_9CHLO|nr:hypothetical protein HYH03_008267 [Edaphochlamys debaryana]|eukprot:KAG2493449.1 hypothetical protein HYH03_008267 [Edaphochlamys debaryana]
MATQVESIKWVPGTRFLVDGFNFQSPRCTAYFLTHYHSDHYTGLNRRFSGSVIYCSRVTARLLRHERGLGPEVVRPLDVGVPVLVEGVRVTPLDANHCPGSLMLLFEVPLGTGPGAGAGALEAGAAVGAAVGAGAAPAAAVGVGRGAWGTAPEEGSAVGPAGTLSPGGLGGGSAGAAAAALAGCVEGVVSEAWLGEAPAAEEEEGEEEGEGAGAAGCRADAAAAAECGAAPERGARLSWEEEAEEEEEEEEAGLAGGVEAAAAGAAEPVKVEAAEAAETPRPACTECYVSEAAALCAAGDATEVEAAGVDVASLDLGPTHNILHTGDCRWQPWMRHQRGLAGVRVDTLFLDTTYAEPRWALPPQEQAIALMVEAMRSALAEEPRTLFLVGAYHIGKERAFLGAAQALGTQVYCSASKRAVLRLLGLPPEHVALLTDDPLRAGVHVAPMGLRPEDLHAYLGRYPDVWSRVVGIRPTGWTNTRRGGVTVRRQAGAVILGVPYSEHSSWTDLCDAVAQLRPRRLVPTVNAASAPQRRSLVDRFAQHMDLRGDRSRLDAYLVPAPASGTPHTTTCRGAASANPGEPPPRLVAAAAIPKPASAAAPATAAAAAAAAAVDLACVDVAEQERILAELQTRMARQRQQQEQRRQRGGGGRKRKQAAAEEPPDAATGGGAGGGKRARRGEGGSGGGSGSPSGGAHVPPPPVKGEPRVHSPMPPSTCLQGTTGSPASGPVGPGPGPAPCVLDLTLDDSDSDEDAEVKDQGGADFVAMQAGRQVDLQAGVEVLPGAKGEQAVVSAPGKAGGGDRAPVGSTAPYGTPAPRPYLGSGAAATAVPSRPAAGSVWAPPSPGATPAAAAAAGGAGGTGAVTQSSIRRFFMPRPRTAAAAVA